MSDEYAKGYNQAKKDALAICDAFADEFREKYKKANIPAPDRKPWVRELYTGYETSALNIKDAIQLMTPEIEEPNAV